MLRAVCAERSELDAFLRGDVQQEIDSGFHFHPWRRRIVPCQQRRRPQQPLYAMRTIISSVPARVAGGADRVGRESRDRDMIGMPMTTLRVVGDDDMRPMASQDADQLRPDRIGGRFGEMLIPIAQYLDVSDAERRRRRPKFGLSHRRQFLDRAERWIAARTRLASRRGDQRDFSSAIGIPPRQTRRDEAFVVRMRENQQDASRHRERMLLRRGHA
jgi:hypothetical protein